eukprot:XP_014623743.1 DUF21 domain-containing protein At2g14520 isoform X2 [Glycine max]
MSLSIVDLEVLAKSGTPQDRNNAAKILPVVRNQHLLLCTLLICNAIAMEALPIFLDSLVVAWGAILISVTLILLFGELLDFLLGHRHKALFHRAELKTLVNLHGHEAGKGGELTHHETTIIAGALELAEKTAGDAMTPITEAFCIDINSKLDMYLMNLILENGHSRVPVFYDQPTNIIGLILIKNLLTIDPEDEAPVKCVTIRRIPRVPETMPLYDILNEFQKGHSHMAIVVKHCDKTGYQSSNNNAYDSARDVKVDIDGEKPPREKNLKTKMSCHKRKSFPNANNLNKGSPQSRKWSKNMYSDILEIDGNSIPKLPEKEAAVGIITMEDVIEELLQGEIFDETDHDFEVS